MSPVLACGSDLAAIDENRCGCLGFGSQRLRSVLDVPWWSGGRWGDAHRTPRVPEAATLGAMEVPSEIVRRVYLLALEGLGPVEIAQMRGDSPEQVGRWLEEAEEWARSSGPSRPTAGEV